MAERTKVLLMEDNPGDVRLLREMLRGVEASWLELTQADRLQAGLARLAEGGFAVVLLDLGLPDSQGLDTLKRVRAEAPQIPIVVLTGLADEAVGIKAVQQGAQDYLIKDQVNGALLAHSLRYAIERQRAEEALRHRHQELSTLYSIAQALSQAVRVDEVLKIALDSVLETLDLPTGAIYLLDAPARELVLTAYRGFGEDFAKVISRLPVGVGMAGRTAQTGEIIIVDNVLELVEPNLKPLFEQERIQSVVNLPLRTKSITLGVMSLCSHSPRSFSAEETSLLETITSQIAVALDNARLFEKMRNLSEMDELTGLFNRRHFYLVLEREVYRTKRYGGCGSLTMLDLDGFKQYNDRWGHTSGDSLLKLFAQTLRSGLRKADIAFRYGGDEFALILPDTEAASAKKMIYRIRSRWLTILASEYPVLKTPVGFSAGIAQFPDNGESADNLVFLADTALYYSKGAGGNKSTLAAEVGVLPFGNLTQATREQVYALAAAVDAKDPHTYGHSRRVAAIAQMLSKARRLGEKELADIYAASLLHDVGKIGVPDAVLTKPGNLTEEDWQVIKRHPGEGARIVGYVKGLAGVVSLILHHHEWFDGRGYPEGLKGEEIPLGAKIIALADAWDTMRTARLYREVLSPEAAVEELRRCSGTQFDPELIEAFCQAIQGQSEGGSSPSP